MVAVHSAAIAIPAATRIRMAVLLSSRASPAGGEATPAAQLCGRSQTAVAVQTLPDWNVRIGDRAFLPYIFRILSGARLRSIADWNGRMNVLRSVQTPERDKR